MMAVALATGRRKINRSKAGNFTIFISLLMFAGFISLPLIYTVISSFKPIDEIFMFPPRFFVQSPTFDNYRLLLQFATNMWVPFSRFLFNSFFVSVVATLGHVLISSMAAYPLAKHRFPGSKLIMGIIVLALLFTGEVTKIPQYVVLARLRLINTYGSLILPALQTALGLFLMRQFMTQVPEAMLEAARIDGANEAKIWWRVVMPTVKPAWLTLMIFAFREIWNSYNSTTYIYDRSKMMLSTMLNSIVNSGIGYTGMGAVVIMILMIPPFVLFLFAQRSVIETMMTSGIK